MGAFLIPGYLRWDGLKFVTDPTVEIIGPPGPEGPPGPPGIGTGPASGDLSGNFPSPTVVNIQSNPISTATPDDGYALIWNGSEWAPGIVASGFTAAHDLSGSSISQTVIGIQGNSIASTVPTNSQALMYNVNGSGQWAPQFGNGPVFNVKDYGAAGDGVTNDTLAIQAALDAAYNSSEPGDPHSGGVVVFPQSEYMISSTLFVNTGVNIIGFGNPDLIPGTTTITALNNI